MIRVRERRSLPTEIILQKEAIKEAYWRFNDGGYQTQTKLHPFPSENIHPLKGLAGICWKMENNNVKYRVRVNLYTDLYIYIPTHTTHTHPYTPCKPEYKTTPFPLRHVEKKNYEN